MAFGAEVSHTEVTKQRLITDRCTVPTYRAGVDPKATMTELLGRAEMVEQLRRSWLRSAGARPWIFTSVAASSGAGAAANGFSQNDEL